MAVGLQEGAAPANARVEETSGWAAAFALTPLTGAGLGGLVVLLLGGGLLLWYLRGRDARALAGRPQLTRRVRTRISKRMEQPSPQAAPLVNRV